MTSVSCDVVVVGAGPVGCFAAAELARAGWDVSLVDENEGPRRDIVCSGIVGAEAYRRYDLPREAAVDRVECGRFVSPSGVEVVYRPPEPPLAHVVDRSRFDAALADRAARAGATLRRGHAARGVRRSRRRIHVETERRGADAGAEFEARVLVVATGHQRWIHRSAGLGSPPGYVHGVHADVPFSDLDAAELYFGRDVAPGYFAWAAPYGTGRARLGVLASQGARSLFERFVGGPRIRPRLGVGPGGDRGANVGASLKSRGIVQGPVRPSYAERVVAVGEAAGQVKTTTAGGIYYGLIGAEIAAEVLDEGLRRGRLDAAFLGRYERRWLAALGGEIESGLALQRLGREVEDRDVDEVFAALNDGLGSTVRRLVRFDWHRPVVRELLRHDRVREYLAHRTASAVRIA